MINFIIYILIKVLLLLFVSIQSKCFVLFSFYIEKPAYVCLNTTLWTKM
jgi:hypothetical protein